MNISSQESSRITFPDPEYAACDDTYVKLLVYPDGHGVDEVTEALRLEPTRIQKKGDEIINSRGRKRVAQRSLWTFSSERRVASKDLRDHLDWLLENIKASEKGIREIQHWHGLKMTVSCVWWSALGHGGPVLWPEQMKVLADLNLECSFDIYFSDD